MMEENNKPRAVTMELAPARDKGEEEEGVEAAAEEAEAEVEVTAASGDVLWGRPSSLVVTRTGVVSGLESAAAAPLLFTGCDTPLRPPSQRCNIFR